MLRLLKWLKGIISILMNRKHLTYIFLKDKVAWEMHFKAKSASPLVYNLFSIIPQLYQVDIKSLTFSKLMAFRF